MGFAIGVCTCVTFCCTHRSVSLEIIVAADQLRSLHEGFFTSFRFLRCVFFFFEIAADLESQLESVSEVPGESIGFSSDILSLIRSAAWDERCSVVEESCALSPPGSEEEERHGVRKRQRHVRRQAGSRPLLRSVDAQPNSRQQRSLTWKNLLAGWPPSKSAGLLPFQHRAVRALLCWEFRLFRESQAAQRYTRLALCLGPLPGISCIRLPVKPARAVPPKSDVPLRRPLDLAAALAKLATVRSRSGCGNNRNGVHRGQRRQIRRQRAPATGRPCHGAAHSTHPSRTPWSNHCGARDESAGRSDDFSREILELAATREGSL